MRQHGELHLLVAAAVLCYGERGGATGVVIALPATAVLSTDASLSMTIVAVARPNLQFGWIRLQQRCWCCQCCESRSLLATLEVHATPCRVPVGEQEAVQALAAVRGVAVLLAGHQRLNRCVWMSGS